MQHSSDQPAVASAPASSANLGPGFDCIALALDLRCRVTAAESTSWDVRSDGINPDAGSTAFIVAAAEGAIGTGHPFRIDIDSDVPQASGLGSSAAVAAATAAACLRAVGQPVDRERIFNLVADLEGHADNAAATVYGGLVAVIERRVLKLDMSPALFPVVAIPAAALPTVDARDVLPGRVPHEAAARNVARAIALVEGMRSGVAFDLAAAAGDELHESYRSDLSPATAKLVAAATSAGALHAAWSGAGPSVLALATAELRTSVAAELDAALAGNGTVAVPEVDRAGLV